MPLKICNGSLVETVGFWGTLAHTCITPYSKDYSLASNLQAKQHGVAFQQSYSSE